MAQPVCVLAGGARTVSTRLDSRHGGAKLAAAGRHVGGKDTMSTVQERDQGAAAAQLCRGCREGRRAPGGNSVAAWVRSGDGHGAILDSVAIRDCDNIPDIRHGGCVADSRPAIPAARPKSQLSNDAVARASATTLEVGSGAPSDTHGACCEQNHLCRLVSALSSAHLLRQLRPARR